MGIIVGSARIDERGCASGGAAGDQKQTTSNGDYCGEVSMQSMYNSSKGWYILRPKSVEHANKMAALCIDACNNGNLGYDQGNRLGIISNGIHSKVKTECDCSSLVREIVKEATGKDPGNFTTYDEATVLENTGLFEKRVSYVSQSQTPLYNGDVLVTKTKGHTMTVCSGNPRSSSSSKPTTPSEPASGNCFPKYTGSSDSIVTALKVVGCSDTSMDYRKKIASANGITNYSGTAAQNIKMVNLLKQGKLVKPGSTGGSTTKLSYFDKYTGSSDSIVSALNAIGCKDTSLTYRKKIAVVNNIANYSGTAAQNIKMVNLLKQGKLVKP